MIDEFTSPPFADDRDSFVSVQECARRMNLSTEQVMELVSKHALRAYRHGGWGEVLVEPGHREHSAEPGGRTQAAQPPKTDDGQEMRMTCRCAQPQPPRASGKRGRARLGTGPGSVPVQQRCPWWADPVPPDRGSGWAGVKQSASCPPGPLSCPRRPV